MESLRAAPETAQVVARGHSITTHACAVGEAFAATIAVGDVVEQKRGDWAEADVTLGRLGRVSQQLPLVIIHRGTILAVAAEVITELINTTVFQATDHVENNAALEANYAGAILAAEGAFTLLGSGCLLTYVAQQEAQNSARVAAALWQVRR